MIFILFKLSPSVSLKALLKSANVYVYVVSSFVVSVLLLTVGASFVAPTSIVTVLVVVAYTTPSDPFHPNDAEPL